MSVSNPQSESSGVSQDSLESIQFENKHPEDEEWTAHIKILNNFTDTDRVLRQIIQYARSGPFYPADMHVELIEAWHHQSVLALLPEKYEVPSLEGYRVPSFDDVREQARNIGYNQAIDDIRSKLESKI